jgi:hypothetical protein
MNNKAPGRRSVGSGGGEKPVKRQARPSSEAVELLCHHLLVGLAELFPVKAAVVELADMLVWEPMLAAEEA